MPAPSKNQNAAKPAAEQLSATLIVRCLSREKSGWVRAAQKSAQKNLTGWVRAALNAAAKN